MEVPALAKLTNVLQRTGHQHRFIEDLHMSPAWSEFQNNMGNNSIALSYCSDGLIHSTISSPKEAIASGPKLVSY